MPQANSGPSLSQQTFIGLLTVAALVPPAWAYVNGGDFHSTLHSHEKTLQSDGWAVACATPTAADCDRTREVETGVRVGPADSPEYQRWVNQLVGRALLRLPTEDAGTIPVEVKHQVARLAREAIRNAVMNNEQVIKEGQTGTLRYQVGAYAFEEYWETNYGGKREIHARRTGLVPFVALRVVHARDRARPQR